MLMTGCAMLIIALVLAAAVYPKFSAINLIFGIALGLIGVMVVVIAAVIGDTVIDEVAIAEFKLSMNLLVSAPVLLLTISAGKTVFNRYILGISSIVILFVFNFFL